jgi:hypothetical protein
MQSINPTRHPIEDILALLQALLLRLQHRPLSCNMYWLRRSGYNFGVRKARDFQGGQNVFKAFDHMSLAALDYGVVYECFECDLDEMGLVWSESKVEKECKEWSDLTL